MSNTNRSFAKVVATYKDQGLKHTEARRRALIDTFVDAPLHEHVTEGVLDWAGVAAELPGTLPWRVMAEGTGWASFGAELWSDNQDPMIRVAVHPVKKDSILEMYDTYDVPVENSLDYKAQVRILESHGDYNSLNAYRSLFDGYTEFTDSEGDVHLIPDASGDAWVKVAEYVLEAYDFTTEVPEEIKNLSGFGVTVYDYNSDSVKVTYVASLTGCVSKENIVSYLKTLPSDVQSLQALANSTQPVSVKYIN